MIPESLNDMVASIRAGGTYVDYLVFDDEGHGFSKKSNRISASNNYLAFLKEYLHLNSLSQYDSLITCYALG